MTEPGSDHDTAIQCVIDAWTYSDPRFAAPAPQSSNPDHQAYVREYSETLGLLAFADQPAMPRPALKNGLLEKIRGTAEPKGLEEPPPVRSVPRAASSRWPLALAAMLGLCTVALAFLAGRVVEQGNALSTLQARVLTEDAGEPGVALVAQAHTTLIEKLRQKERTLHMITEVAQQAYPMRLAGVPARPAAVGAAHGIVYVCGQHQRWYLNIRGLDPAPAGQEYNLWFVTATGPVHGGVIEVRGQEPSELDADTMPLETHGFTVTLEEAGARNSPAGRSVLVGDQSVRL